MRIVNNNKKVIVVLLLLAVAAASIGVSRAFFSDIESAAHEVSLGTLNLRVGSSDPISLPIDLSGLNGHDVMEYTVDLVNTGNLPGNFWISPEVNNSSEGVNSEAEGDTEGEGEVDDCVILLLAVDSPNQDEQLLLENTLAELEDSYDQAQQTVIDDMVNSGQAALRIRVESGGCTTDAMGDTVDLKLDFHLDQQS